MNKTTRPLVTLFLFASIFFASIFVSCSSTHNERIPASVESEKPIVLNHTNCKRNTWITMGGIPQEFEDLVKDHNAKVAYICVPQGELREIVNQYEIKSPEGSNYTIGKTDLSFTVTDYHQEGLDNIIIYSPINVAIAVTFAQGRYSISYSKEEETKRAPCHQEFALACPKGQIDACLVKGSKYRYHKCISR